MTHFSSLTVRQSIEILVEVDYFFGGIVTEFQFYAPLDIDGSSMAANEK